MPDEPEFLYHYTSAMGLEGILRDRCIWATDTAFLNDAEEIHFAGRQLESMLIDFGHQLDQANPDPGSADYQRRTMVGTAASALAKFLHPEDDLFPDTSPHDGATYVACFSTQGDHLSQWRGYGGRGYSIAFTKAGIDAMGVEGEDIPALRDVGSAVPVAYGHSAISDLMTEVNDRFITQRIPAHPSNSGFWDAVNFCMPRLARIKHEAFQDEHEWRSIVSRYGHEPVNRVFFRYGVRLIPYVKLNFERSAVSHIYIGPGSDFDGVRALRALLRVTGYDLDAVSIERSTAPYRDAGTF